MGEIVTPNGIRYAKNFDWLPAGGFTSIDLRCLWAVFDCFTYRSREQSGEWEAKRIRGIVFA